MQSLAAIINYDYCYNLDDGSSMVLMYYNFIKVYNLILYYNIIIEYK